MEVIFKTVGTRHWHEVQKWLANKHTSGVKARLDLKGRLPTGRWRCLVMTGCNLHPYHGPRAFTHLPLRLSALFSPCIRSLIYCRPLSRYKVARYKSKHQTEFDSQINNKSSHGWLVDFVKLGNPRWRQGGFQAFVAKSYVSFSLRKLQGYTRVWM